MNIVEKLISLQLRGYGCFPRLFLRLMGVVVPREVVFDDSRLGGTRFVHGSVGTVLHPKTRIGKNVWIFQGVTIGKATPWDSDGENEGCVVEDNAILCAGAKILFKDNEVLTIGRGSIVAANAVLTQSTGPNEVWGGIPARKLSLRKT